MSRNKSLTVLQKTYDDAYLSCSTAVYHESQGNEIEATRHWKTALNLIYDHNANKALPVFAARSDTEKALADALKQLELQCKERIDLLEALCISRQEGSNPTSSAKVFRSVSNSDVAGSTKDSIGQGTIPAVTYSELSRPALPKRPSVPKRESLTASVASNSSRGTAPASNPTLSPLSGVLSADGYVRQETPIRSPSPDKRTMRTTLRSGRTNERSSRSNHRSAPPAGEGPSKAATLAWTAISSRDRSTRALSPNPTRTGQYSPARNSSEHARKPGSPQVQWDSHSRRLVTSRDPIPSPNDGDYPSGARISDDNPFPSPSLLSVSAASSALNCSVPQESPSIDPGRPQSNRNVVSRATPPPIPISRRPGQELSQDAGVTSSDDFGQQNLKPSSAATKRRPVARRPEGSPRPVVNKESEDQFLRRQLRKTPLKISSSSSEDDDRTTLAKTRGQDSIAGNERLSKTKTSDSSDMSIEDVDSMDENAAWKSRKASILRDLPPGVDEAAANQILNDVVVQGDEVRWSDVAGLQVAKLALREAVVYPFLRPDLFMGLREPARGMLLFGPPGTGKTMLARAVATESRSTFFSISASSLTSKFLGESEKLVRALFGLAKVLAPSIIFVDEIDSLLSQRSGSGEHEATRRIKTEFLIQWSDLQRAAAGRESSDRDKDRGDANRVLVLAATNLPWAIDEAARRRFVRRQYIPLPEPGTRETQLQTLLGQQKHSLAAEDIQHLVDLTDGFSGSDITALAKDAAMGPLRSLGEALLNMTMDDIRPILLEDFTTSLSSIRPSVSKAGLKEYEDWAKEFGERGG